MDEFTIEMCYPYKGSLNCTVTLKKGDNGFISVISQYGELIANCFTGRDVGFLLVELCDDKYI